MHHGLPRLGREIAAELVVRHGHGVVDIGRQQCIVTFGEELGERRREAGVGRAIGRERSVASAFGAHRAHWDDRRRQAVGDVLHNATMIGAPAVELVDEENGRDAQSLQGPHQHTGLRLHTLDGGDHQHGAIEDVEHALHLGDEIRVAGSVDQVDGDVADNERNDRRLDGDASPAFQLQRIGPRAAFVDAADLVDDAGGVEQPLGQTGLTGVDMGQDPEVQRVHEASCPLQCSQVPDGWTRTLRASRSPR